MKYIVLTFGCQMNRSDSERIEGLFLDMGMKEAGRAEEADLIILNTCSVRQTAEDRVYGLARNFAKLKKKKPHLLVAITGCVAGRDKDGKIKAKMPGVDFFFPISDLPHLPEMINEKWDSRLRGNDSRGSKKMDYLGVVPKAKEWWRGSVVIQTGCSNYCTYCVVPYARGHEKNRPVGAILKEAREMAKNGAKEIQLLGQAVNSWRATDPQNFSKNNPFNDYFWLKNQNTELVAIATSSDQEKNAGTNIKTKNYDNGSNGANDFAALLWEIDQISGVNRVSFASAHPMYMTDGIIKALKLPKMMNYLHLPVQSGNDEILHKMNRKYSVIDYLRVIKKIHKVKPDMALATDIIVGFPSETKKQFADTIALYKKCDFDLSYNAMYSPRTGTAAYKAFADDVPREEKRGRWLVLQKLMEKNALRKNKKFVGKIVEVLVDGCAGGKCWGFSREYKRVVFVGKNFVGQIVNVKINKAKEWELEGKYEE